MMIDGNDNLVHRHFEFFRCRRNNTGIGLVRYQPVNVRLHHTVGCQGLVDDASQCIYRHLEYFVAAHFDEGVTFLNLVKAVGDSVWH